jgi:hypothetical protein
VLKRDAALLNTLEKECTAFVEEELDNREQTKTLLTKADSPF